MLFQRYDKETKGFIDCHARRLSDDSDLCDVMKNGPNRSRQPFTSNTEQLQVNFPAKIKSSINFKLKFTGANSKQCFPE